MAYHAIQPVPIRPWHQWALAAAILTLAVASSWVGIHNQFSYDDVFIIQNNKLIRDLGDWYKVFGQPYWPVQWGADGYRPLTVLAFMLQYAAGNTGPMVFHAVNITLYALVSVSVFFLARTCLPLAGALVAGMLFAVHPLHVEAVASVVGQAELWVALCVIPAVTIYINGRNANDLNVGRMAAICVLFALACLFKEHGVVLPVLLLAAELTVVNDREPIAKRFVKLRPFVLMLTAIAFAYLWLHLEISSQVLTGFHEYVPFSTNKLGPQGRWWTMFGVVPDWLRLFLWPARLSTEYGPPEYPVVDSFEPYQLPGIIILLAVIALIIVARRRSPTVSFSVAFAFIALLPTSNFIVASGILLAERTLFLPSVGVVLSLGAAVPWIYRHIRPIVARATIAAALIVVVGLGIWRSHTRTLVWYDNDSLFNAGVKDAPNVYRTHYMLGAWKFHLKRKVEGERSYQKAMELYDKDPYVYYSLGQEYLVARMYRAAIPYFRKTLAVDSGVIEARARIALCLAELGEWDEAEAEARRALRANSHSRGILRRIIAMSKQKRAEAGRAGVSPTDTAATASSKLP